VSGPVFIFCAPGHVFDGTEGLGSHFHVLRARTRFQRYRGHRVPFSYFAPPYSSLAVLRASGTVIMFCARTRFRRCRVRRVPFSCSDLTDSFSAVRRGSGPDFIFCAPGLIFGGTEGICSRFHVLRARTLFRRYRGRPIQFSCFPLRDMFSVVPRASGPVFRFCAPELIFGDAECVGSLVMF
jgi:hypothetical protein